MRTPPARVLVVDDEPSAAEMLAVLVAASYPGVEVHFALDGVTALRIAREWSPHLVITDIDMPLLSGIEFALEVRGLQAATQPVIGACTGNPRWADDPMAKAVFDVVILKPVDIEALLRWVRSALTK